MNRKRVLLPAISLSIAAALLLSGCVQDKKTDDAGTGTPSPTSSVAPTPNATDEPKYIDKTLDSSEVALAGSLFPDAQATESFSKEQVQIAQMNAYEYYNTAISTDYFLNGNFSIADFPLAKVDETFSKYFENKAWADVQANLKDRTTIEPTTNVPLYRIQMQLLFWYSAVNNEERPLALPESCYTPRTSDENVPIFSPCLAEPPTFENFSYKEAKDDDGTPGIIVTSKVHFKPLILVDGVLGSQTVTYNFSTFLVPNEYPDWQNGVHSMLIKGLDSPAPTWTAWEAN